MAKPTFGKTTQTLKHYKSYGGTVQYQAEPLRDSNGEKASVYIPKTWFPSDGPFPDEVEVTVEVSPVTAWTKQ
jgi:hypothetical protein